VEIHTDMGRFIMVAKHHENIAEIYEKELEDQEKAIDHYQVPSPFFQTTIRYLIPIFKPLSGRYLVPIFKPLSGT
jgi:hypothetical protein